MRKTFGVKCVKLVAFYILQNFTKAVVIAYMRLVFQNLNHRKSCPKRRVPLPHKATMTSPLLILTSYPRSTLEHLFCFEIAKLIFFIEDQDGGFSKIVGKQVGELNYTRPRIQKLQFINISNKSLTSIRNRTLGSSFFTKQ